MGTGQDWPAQGRHQLWAESCPDSGAVSEGLPSLQPRTRTPVSEQHSARRAQAPKAARHIAALVGTRVRCLQALVNVWKVEQGSIKFSCESATRELYYENRHSRCRTQTWEAYSLGPVTSGTHTTITSDCVLADLSVATHVTSILALVNIWKICS